MRGKITIIGKKSIKTTSLNLKTNLSIKNTEAKSQDNIIQQNQEIIQQNQEKQQKPKVIENMEPDDMDYTPVAVLDQRNEDFFSFPYSWVWRSSIMGIKFRANSTRSTTQLHIIQDFYLKSQENSQKESQVISYENSYVSVMIKVITSQNQKRVIAVCSSLSCNSSGDLIR